MRVSLPHNLSKTEVRKRLNDRAGELAGLGDMAKVDAEWRDQDHIDVVINTMGQTLKGDIAIEAKEVVINLDLPFMLSLMEPAIAEKVREHGQKMLT